jgi:outer membrane protein OmpA-like peptidoglycan-associated protein
MRYVVFWLGVCLCTSADVQAQTEPCPDATHPKALKTLERIRTDKGLEVDDRLELLAKALEMDPECAACRLEAARLYFRRAKMNRPGGAEASALLAPLLQSCPDFHAEAWFMAGGLAYGNRDYEAAQAHFNAFLDFPSDDLDRLGKQYDEQAREIREVLPRIAFELEFAAFAAASPPAPVAVVNTASDEFLPALSPDATLLWFTRREQHKPMGDLVTKEVEVLYEARRPHAAVPFGTPVAVGTPFDAGLRFGGASIALDHREVYIAAHRPTGSNPDNIDLMRADYEVEGTGSDGRPMYRWSDLEALPAPINSPDGWEAQPALSPDGNELFFAAVDATALKDRDGNPTMDLRRCVRTEDGTWSTPESLPEPLNSRFHDKAPFLHPDGKTLYFASNRTPGGGGFDVWVSRRDSSGNWGAPKNLGAPLNTTGDEHGLVVANDGREGFLAGRRPGTKALDVLSFPLPEVHRAEAVEILRGEVLNASGQPAEGARVVLAQPDAGTAREIQVREDDGSFAVVLRAEERAGALLVVEGDGIAFDAVALPQTPSPDPIALVAEALKPEERFELRGITYPTNGSALNGDSELLLRGFAGWLQRNPGLRVAVEGHTDDVGDAATNASLSERRAATVRAFLVGQGVAAERITARGYGESTPRADNSTEAGRALNRRTEFAVKD